MSTDYTSWCIQTSLSIKCQGVKASKKWEFIFILVALKKWLNDFCRALTPSYSFRTLYILSSRQVSTRFIFIVLPTKQKGEKKLQVCHETWKEHTRTSSSIALSCGLTFFFGRFEEQLDPIVSILYIRKQSYETEWLIVVKQFEIECIQERLSFSICSFENILAKDGILIALSISDCGCTK